jgi:hypothetical protein
MYLRQKLAERGLSFPGPADKNSPTNTCLK